MAFNKKLTLDGLKYYHSKIKTLFSNVNTSISNEVTRATTKENEIATNLSKEITRAKNAENTLSTNKLDKTTVATSSTLGLVKSGTDITVDSLGNVSVNDNSHKHTVSNISDLTATASELNVLDGITATTQELNYVDGVTSNIQTQLNSKSTNGHTHDDRYYTESEIDTTVTDINSSISSHTSNTSNPHSVTKAQVGLGNVENKSSATIRGEITKSDVTTALGYTPYTPNEVDNKFSTLETNIDWKESVATYDNIATTYPNPVDGWTVNVKDTDYTYRYNGTEWVAISANAIPKATNSVDGLLSKEDHTNYDDANSKKHTHSNKSVIDGISSTDVSNWNAAKTHADSAHAPSNAQENVQSDWNATSGDAFIKNKPTIPTKVGELTNDKDYATKTEVDEAIDNLEIGGRNLATETGNLQGSLIDRIGISISTSKVVDTDVPSKQCLAIKTTEVKTVGKRGFYLLPYNFINRIKVGDIITFSFYAKSSRDISLTVDIEFCNHKTKEINLTSAWKKYELTGTVDHVTGSGTAITFYSIDYQVDDVISISSIKIENGNKATPWTPAIEDTEAEIQSVDNKLTTNLLKPTLETTTQNGVTCTNNGDGTYTLNGTASETFEIRLADDIHILKGKYYSCLTKEAINDFYMSLWYSSNELYGVADEKQITITNQKSLSPFLHFDSGAELNNVVIKPMFTTNLNATYDDFVPYTGSTGKINSDLAEVRKDFDEHTHAISDVTGLQNTLDGKASSSHTHTKSQITDFPTSLPASDVYSWAKESTKPSYTASEVGALPISDKNGVEVETPTIFNSELSVSKSLNIFKDSFTNMDFSFNDSNSIPYWNYFDGESEKKLYHPNKSGTIATTDDIKNTDTKNTAGSTNTSSKIYLVGATSQDTNPQTYSHDTAYVGTDGCLYSNSTKVSVEGHIHDVSQISGLNYYDASLQRTANTILAAPNGSNGAATFRKLVESDLPNSYLPLSGGTLTDELVIDTGNEAKGIYFVNPSDKSKGTRVSYVNGSPFVQGAWDAVVLKENGTLLSNKYAEYEEGTFSLILGKNEDSFSYVNKPDIDQVTIPGRYIRVGNMCYISTSNMMVVFSNSTEGYLRIAGGLPFSMQYSSNSIGFIGINSTPNGTLYPINDLDFSYAGGYQFRSEVVVSEAFYFKMSLWYDI